jgi:hypothetical protein
MAIRTAQPQGPARVKGNRPIAPKKVNGAMNDFRVVNNEAEFERWLIAALEWERRRVLGAPQPRNESDSSPAEPGGDSEDSATRFSPLSC